MAEPASKIQNDSTPGDQSGNSEPNSQVIFSAENTNNANPASEDKSDPWANGTPPVDGVSVDQWGNKVITQTNQQNSEFNTGTQTTTTTTQPAASPAGYTNGATPEGTVGDWGNNGASNQVGDWGNSPVGSILGGGPTAANDNNVANDNTAGGENDGNADSWNEGSTNQAPKSEEEIAEDEEGKPKAQEPEEQAEEEAQQEAAATAAAAGTEEQTKNAANAENAEASTGEPAESPTSEGEPAQAEPATPPESTTPVPTEGAAPQQAPDAPTETTPAQPVASAATSPASGSEAPSAGRTNQPAPPAGTLGGNSGGPTPPTGSNINPNQSWRQRMAGRGIDGLDRAGKGLNKLADKGEERLANKEKANAAAGSPYRKPANNGSNKAAESDDPMMQGPNLSKAKGDSMLGKANIQRELAEQSARKVTAVAGKLGASKKTQQYISVNLIAGINLLFLIIELLLIETIIAGLIFVIHLVAFTIWLVTKERWKRAWLGAVALFALPVISVMAVIGTFVSFLLLFAVVGCQHSEGVLPFGIPVGWLTTRISAFGTNWGALSQICDVINVRSTGVGTTAAGATPGQSASSSVTRTMTLQSGDVVLIDDLATSPPIIAGTQLTRPPQVPATLSYQVNAAGYTSPAQCLLGDLPYSESVRMQKVVLDDGRERIVSLPAHQTIDCIQSDAARRNLRAIQTGTVVKRVQDDAVLGNYVTIEHPNGLRVSYYHLASVPDDLLLGTIVGPGQLIGVGGQTGANTFVGTKMQFEYKTSQGGWQVFNPISSTPALSIVTPFPCADNRLKSCLLE
ncbi:peptidoglycan DD-metalloendopeptidase family protein [Candidatus Gracilibacteria bacterium]|nr:peptidoglycan DD-metalloendopeptidase family protein [Candidatus Gracilibacteria bacterium]